MLEFSPTHPKLPYLISPSQGDEMKHTINSDKIFSLVAILNRIFEMTCPFIEKPGEFLVEHWAQYYCLAKNLDLEKFPPCNSFYYQLKKDDYESYKQLQVMGKKLGFSHYYIRYQLKKYEYERSKEVVAEDLGFSHYRYLARWAQNNKEIWGNGNALFMFHKSVAFTTHIPHPNGKKLMRTCCGDENITFKIIRDQWAAAGDRLKEKENRLKEHNIYHGELPNRASK